MNIYNKIFKAGPQALWRKRAKFLIKFPKKFWKKFLQKKTLKSFPGHIEYCQKFG